MGREIQEICLNSRADRFALVGGSARSVENGTQNVVSSPASIAAQLQSTQSQVILDFSSASGNQVLLTALQYARGIRDLAVLIGSTGMTEEDYQSWRSLAKERELRLLFAPNTSIGILMAVKAASLIAPSLKHLGFDIEITETHHRRKQDAPSGTAKFLAESVSASVGGLDIVTDRHGGRKENELGVHAVRGGGVFGEHEVRLIGDSEEVCVSHRAFSRTLFADGALVLASWLVAQKSGVYGLLDIDPKELFSDRR
jgi:4-hydroxy-tetrahydrodipicolinate reductase